MRDNTRMINNIYELEELIVLIKREFPYTVCCGTSRQKDVLEEVIKIYAGSVEGEKESWRG